MRTNEVDLKLSSINSKAAFFILKAGAINIHESGKLITIVTALLAAFTGLYTTYAGAKAPVEHFTRGVAKELMGKRVSVNAIAPGPMDTRKSLSLYLLHLQTMKSSAADRQVAFFYGQETPESVAYHKSNALEGRLTDVKDIAPVVKFLCTEGQWITGQTIFANGGYTTR